MWSTQLSPRRCTLVSSTELDEAGLVIGPVGGGTASQGSDVVGKTSVVVVVGAAVARVVLSFAARSVVVEPLGSAFLSSLPQAAATTSAAQHATRNNIDREGRGTPDILAPRAAPRASPLRCDATSTLCERGLPC